MDHGICGVDQAIIIVGGQAKARHREITAKDPQAGLEMLIKSREIQVQWPGLQQAVRSFLRVAGADQQVQRSTVLLEQVGGNVRADVSGRTGQEYRHVAPLVPVLTTSPFSGRAANWRLRGGRASRGRPSIRG